MPKQSASWIQHVLEQTVEHARSIKRMKGAAYKAKCVHPKRIIFSPSDPRMSESRSSSTMFGSSLLTSCTSLMSMQAKP